jgi:hypothetical protein
MYDPLDGRPRYLVHYSDGGSGMRRHDRLLEVGIEFRDGGERYRVVKPPSTAHERRSSRRRGPEGGAGRPWPPCRWTSPAPPHPNTAQCSVSGRAAMTDLD